VARTKSATTDSGKSWMDGEMSSTDYFDQVRRSAARNTFGGRLLCTLLRAASRLVDSCKATADPPKSRPETRSSDRSPAHTRKG